MDNLLYMCNPFEICTKGAFMFLKHILLVLISFLDADMNISYTWMIDQHVIYLQILLIDFSLTEILWHNLSVYCDYCHYP